MWSGLTGACGAHRARLETKHLRYLLEPVRALMDPAKAVVHEAKQLQTLLGDLRDAQLFREWLLGSAEEAGAHKGLAELSLTLGMDAVKSDEGIDAMPGLVYLGKRACEREQALADEVKAWLGGDGLQRLGEAVHLVREALGDSGAYVAHGD